MFEFESSNRPPNISSLLAAWSIWEIFSSRLEDRQIFALQRVHHLNVLGPKAVSSAAFKGHRRIQYKSNSSGGICQLPEVWETKVGYDRSFSDCLWSGDADWTVERPCCGWFSPRRWVWAPLCAVTELKRTRGGVRLAGHVWAGRDCPAATTTVIWSVALIPFPWVELTGRDRHSEKATAFLRQCLCLYSINRWELLASQHPGLTLL